MNAHFKHSAIPASGYIYQTLAGLNLLCDWLDDPTLYQWVKFEADDEEDAKGLDDIVAMGKDDLLHLRQVKFTVNAFDDDNVLSLTWLLQHKPKGRSLLQKWFGAYTKLGADQVASAALITNRRPDAEFDRCLEPESGLIQQDLLSELTRNQIAEQIGTSEAVTKFFQAFQFQHSYKGFEALERNIINRLIPRHTTRFGWLSLYRDSFDWAVRKNFPAPKGVISLEILRGVIAKERPAPIDQSFRVPDGYRPPNADFAETFLASLADSPRDIRILWGSPGQGKSTFLSYLCRELQNKQNPVIRHHYFLSLGDSSDRFTLDSVANSLMHQIELHHSDAVKGLSPRPENLREWIAACGNYYKVSGIRFVVVVDGLDHVWREQDKDRGLLNSLFGSLLPVPENVSLIVGTQKVDSEQLPAQFACFVADEDWIELPRMTVTVIRKWLQVQLDAGRFELKARANDQLDLLAEVAVAFEKISQGHPLVLTYSFEALAREHRILSENLVVESVSEPPQSVIGYYLALWQRLSSKARDGLHLMADADFIWPQQGLESCLEFSGVDLRKEIGHLYTEVDAGHQAFHGSLYVFVKSIAEHDQRIAVLLPMVIFWLEATAPPFLRWGWLWIYQHRVGSSQNLLTKTDRRWLLDSVSRSYPVEQMVKILGAAEREAFTRGQFGLAVRRRWIKTRLLNGPDFQIEDYDRLLRCAMLTTDDSYPVLLLASKVYAASINDLHHLAVQYLAADRLADAVDCQERMRTQINDRLAAGALDHKGLERASIKYLEIVAATGEFTPSKLIQSLRGIMQGGKEDLFGFFLAEESRHLDIARLMRYATLPLSLQMRQQLELAVIRLAGWSDAKVHEWPAFSRFRKSTISACWTLLYDRKRYCPTAFKRYDPAIDVKGATGSGEDVERYLHNFFFGSLMCTLELRGAVDPAQAPNYADRPWLSKAIVSLDGLAIAAGKILARGDVPAFALPYRLLDSVGRPSPNDVYTEYRPFKAAVNRIAADLFLLCKPRSKLETIPRAEWKDAQRSQHFDIECWRSEYLTRGFKLLNSAQAQEEIEARRKSTIEAITPFNERTESYLQLCEWAIRYELPQLARDLLIHAFRCVLGYGWRKDPSLAYVMQALEAFADVKVDAKGVRGHIRKLASITTNIDEMCEKSGINGSEMGSLLARVMPEAFAAFYQYWLQREEWHTAELTFASMLKYIDLKDPLSKAVTPFLWDNPAAMEIRQRAKDGDEDARRLLILSAENYGLPVESLGKDRYANSSTPEKAPTINARTYSAKDLDRLVADLAAEGTYSVEHRAMREWFDHAIGQGEGITILRELERYQKAESVPSSISSLFDAAFHLSLKLEGRVKAYGWLVAAQIERHGWDAYHGWEEAEARFKLVAQHCSDKWMHFVQTTTGLVPGQKTPRHVIPHDKLVFFLLLVGQIEAAKDLLNAMVETTIEDFEDQPLVSPSWLQAADVS